jgi:hypothetical protein
MGYLSYEWKGLERSPGCFYFVRCICVLHLDFFSPFFLISIQCRNRLHPLLSYLLPHDSISSAERSVRGTARHAEEEKMSVWRMRLCARVSLDAGDVRVPFMGSLLAENQLHNTSGAGEHCNMLIKPLFS